LSNVFIENALREMRIGANPFVTKGRVMRLGSTQSWFGM